MVSTTGTVEHLSKCFGINEDALIREGSIPEHPGWEDLIILENLDNSIKNLKKELSHVRNLSIS